MQCVGRLAALVVLAMTSAAYGGADNNPSGVRSEADWPYLGGNPQSQQFSELKQINSGNVGGLGLLWYSDVPVKEGLIGNALVKDGIVYQSAPRGGAIATDVASGATLWHFIPQFDFAGYTARSMWAAHATRGIGLDEKNIYVVGGCQLYGVDRKSGVKVWETRVCDPAQDLGMIAAPRTGAGKVFVGVSNGEMGSARGFAAAYEAGTGKELWRFYSVPGDPKKPYENEQMAKAARTWDAKYWATSRGGGGVWEGMTYDPKTNLLLFGTGDPKLGDAPPRDHADQAMLFADSLIAVDASTGNYVWHFQFLQGDVLDMGDGTAHIMLADLPIKGKTRHVVMQAAKNGFFYTLDAATGKFISASNYVPNTNYYPINAQTGQLRIHPELRYWEHPQHRVVSQPGGWGAHSWQLSSYDPQTQLVYIPAFIFPIEVGGGLEPDNRSDNALATDSSSATLNLSGRLVAWDPVAAKERWHVNYPVVMNGGVLSTAGGLVFQGTPEGRLLAYTAGDGQLVWSYDAHAIILGAPSTVMVGSKQVILVPSGDATGGTSPKISTRLSSTDKTISAPSRLLAFALGGNTVLPLPVARKLLQPPRPLQPTSLAATGKKVYESNYCLVCHGEYLSISDASYVPDLRNIRETTLQAMPQILRDGAYSSMGMPRFPALTDADISALQAYIINEAWAAYDKQRQN